MIVVTAALVALTPPATDLAMLDRLWIVRGGQNIGVLKRRGSQVLSDQPKIRGVVLYPKRLDLVRRVRSDHVEAFGEGALACGQEFRVERELQNGTAPGVLGELGIDHLVGPAIMSARFFDPAQDIRPTKPSVITKGRLNDNIHPRPHRTGGTNNGVAALGFG
jgi:hypothetical protein